MLTTSDDGRHTAQTTLGSTCTPALSRTLVLLFSFACGLSVANIYLAQPLLDAMAVEFHVSQASIGLVVSVTQIGYALGLLLIVPLGDLLDRRQLIVSQLLMSVVALLGVALAPTFGVMLGAVFVVGLVAVVIQVLVAFTATLAKPEERGGAVGKVTSGVVIGILLARCIAGALTDLGGWRLVYLVSAGATTILSTALWKMLPSGANLERPQSYRRLLSSLVTLWLKEPLLRSKALLALFTFAAFSVLWTALVLPLSSPPLSFSHRAIGLVGLVGLAGAAAASQAGHWADRGWQQWTYGLALVLLLFSWLLIGNLHRSLSALVIGIVLLDLAVQAIHVTNQSVLFRQLPGARSRLVALYMTFYSIGSGTGAVASTWAYARSGWAGVSALGAGLSACALAFWVLTRRGDHDTSQNAHHHQIQFTEIDV